MESLVAKFISSRHARTERAERDWLARADRTFSENLRFVGAFLRSPGRVGALLPSSRVLARAMIAGANLATASAVVELGPGTGSFTRAILERVGERTTFVALELDWQAVVGLRRNFPDLRVYHDSAERIQRYLARHGRSQADYVISGLPWANMGAAVQRRIMGNVARALAPDGVFTTFTYLISPLRANGRHYRRILGELFDSVEISAVVWRNFPPALVYRCTQVRPFADAPAPPAA
jgi:phospholipid N-methyltransferase